MVALGRRPAKDTRDAMYPLRSLIPEVAIPTSKYWRPGKILDQGNIGACVGYGCDQWYRGAPSRHSITVADPLGIYNAAQLVDEFEDTPPEEGTSIRAGVKILQQRNLIESYHWANNLQDVVNFVLTSGPVIAGTNWYSSMFAIDGLGLVQISSGAQIAGGHCYVIDGANTNTHLFRCRNSWGPKWGIKGLFFISFETFSRLLSEDGEACAGIEHKI